jgi:glyoxylase-like metal-dependent hydrolase (beta-lactamase superfamily II)
MVMSSLVEPFFDDSTSTISYVVYEAAGSVCAVIDSVLDFDAKSGRTCTTSADRIVNFVRSRRLQVEWILETHAHADHLSGAPYLRKHLGGKIAIGENIRTVQGAFKKIFNLEASFQLDGSQFDHLFAADEEFAIGRLRAKALNVPGHTPADMAYKVEDAIFVGDTMFMPDVGTARCDFPGGDAHQLYASARRLLSFPDATRLFMCHDYPPARRRAAWQTTIAEQRASNIHIRDGVSEEQFVKMRTARDATLGMPALILPSIQVNIRAGELPPAEENGVRYLKLPIDVL